MLLASAVPSTTAFSNARFIARRTNVEIRRMGGYSSDKPTPPGASKDKSSDAQKAEGPILNRYSSMLTQPKKQGASQAMLYATGLSPDDLCKPQIGVGSVWFEGNPCNMHLLRLGTEVKKSVEGAGLVGYQFNTVGVSDGISMGTSGMRYSLQSRDVIADSIETIMVSPKQRHKNNGAPCSCLNLPM